MKSAGAVEASKEEFQKRLDDHYPGATFAVRRVHSDGLSVMGGTARDKEVIDVMLQNTWESAEDWYQPSS
ncbi:DinI family protein [Rahnella variigena]|uniref:DinI family protein n=1 Tax=Rahnella variigena TaxID=574964 RepID=UPI002168191E|nr:DinI family protein [Rahnella variigena]